MKKTAFRLIEYQSDKNHPKAIKKCFNFVKSDLENAGLKVKAYSPNYQFSLVAGRQLKKHYQFFLIGHLDVVPADYKNAFKPTIRGNRLYGRGASDMKGVTAAMIKLLKDLATNQPQADVGLMITTDEEIGGFNGVDYLVNTLGYTCDCAVVPDGGRNWQLVTAEKGVFLVEINSKGKSAHGSQPWLGDNALDKLIRICSEIRNQMPKVSQNDRWHPTCNLGLISGGNTPNMVPAFARAHLDFRHPEKKQKNTIVKIIEKAVAMERGVTWKITVEGAPLVNNPQNKYFRKIQAVAKKNRQELKIIKEDGASDGRFFSVKAIPVIMFKPVCSEAHIYNEWIDLKSLEKFYQILKQFILSFDKKKIPLAI